MRASASSTSRAGSEVCGARRNSVSPSGCWSSWRQPVRTRCTSWPSPGPAMIWPGRRRNSLPSWWLSATVRGSHPAGSSPADAAETVAVRAAAATAKTRTNRRTNCLPNAPMPAANRTRLGVRLADPWRAGSDRAVGQHPQRGHAGAEQVLAAAHGHEARLGLDEVGRVALDRHLAVGGLLADQRVLVRAEAERVAVVHPERLDGLELAPDVRLEADEHQAALGAVALGAARGRRPAEGAAAADDPVAVGEPPVEELRHVARVRPPDVGADRAAQPLGVVGVEEVVDPRGVGGDLRVRRVGRELQRRAVLPAADDLRPE